MQCASQSEHETDERSAEAPKFDLQSYVANYKGRIFMRY